MRLIRTSIKNFRSIHECVIDHEKVTALVGKNNSGKSAVLRALNAFFNYEDEKYYFITDVHQYSSARLSRIELTFKDVPNNMIQAIVDANDTRKKHIADQIISRKPATVGIYRLTMKTGSDNFRQSAIQDVIHHIKNEGIEVIVYEPVLEEELFDGLKLVNDFEIFKSIADVIVENRLDNFLESVRVTVYIQDVFNRD